MKALYGVLGGGIAGFLVGGPVGAIIGSLGGGYLAPKVFEGGGGGTTLIDAMAIPDAALDPGALGRASGSLPNAFTFKGKVWRRVKGPNADNSWFETSSGEGYSESMLQAQIRKAKLG